MNKPKRRRRPAVTPSTRVRRPRMDELSERLIEAEQRMGTAEGRFLLVPLYEGEEASPALAAQLEGHWGLKAKDSICFSAKHIPRGDRPFGRFENWHGSGWVLHPEPADFRPHGVRLAHRGAG